MGVVRTRSWPVTRMRTPLLGVGWASRVETWCLTFSKGRPCGTQKCQPRNKAQPQAVTSFARKGELFRDSYRELLDDGVDTEDGGRLKGQHGLGPLFRSHVSIQPPKRILSTLRGKRSGARASRAPKTPHLSPETRGPSTEGTTGCIRGRKGGGARRGSRDSSGPRRRCCSRTR